MTWKVTGPHTHSVCCCQQDYYYHLENDEADLELAVLHDCPGGNPITAAFAQELADKLNGKVQG